MSRWLYVGQGCANAGFLAYSISIEDAVLIVTNVLLVLLSGLGLLSVLLHRQADPEADAAEGPAAAGLSGSGSAAGPR